MRNVLLLGASALVLSLTGVGAYAYDYPEHWDARSGLRQTLDQQSNSQYDLQSGEAFRPRAVLGAEVGNDEGTFTYPQHWDARSGLGPH